MNALEIRFLLDDLTKILNNYKVDSEIVSEKHLRDFFMELYCFRIPHFSNLFKGYCVYKGHEKHCLTLRDLKEFIKEVILKWI